ncbi:MAG: hypothetical protein ACK502_08565 [Alphaproteobacteria bacterium]
MSVYKYPESQVIDEVVFKKTAQGAVRAYLHAKDDIPSEKVHEIRDVFKQNGWQAVAFNLDGKSTLEVRGLKTEKKFLELLNEHKWVSGNSDHQKNPEDRISFMDKFRKTSLQSSGVAMAIADIGFIIYGLKEAKIHKAIDPTHEKRDFREALAGFSYLTGSTLLTLYGRNDQSDLQVRDVAGAMLKHAKDKGLIIPDDSALTSIGTPKKENTLGKLNNFLRQHPSEVGNMSYFTAGLLIAWSALTNRALAKPRPEMTAKQISEMRKGGWGDTALGTTTMASGLIGTFFKEKAPDPDAPHKEGIAKWWDNFMRSPLAIAGAGYVGSTLCHAYTTYTERKEALRAVADTSLSAKEHMLADMKVKAVPWRVLFIGATLVGEALLIMSSKGHGEGVQIDDTVDQSIYAISADLIARQPAEMRAGLIDYMSGYLADPKVLGGDRQKIAAELKVDIDNMLKNPWALKSAKTQETVVIPDVTHSKTIESSTWQSKISAQPAAGSQPQLSS